MFSLTCFQLILVITFQTFHDIQLVSYFAWRFNKFWNFPCRHSDIGFDLTNNNFINLEVRWNAEKFVPIFTFVVLYKCLDDAEDVFSEQRTYYILLDLDRLYSFILEILKNSLNQSCCFCWGCNFLLLGIVLKTQSQTLRRCGSVFCITALDFPRYLFVFLSNVFLIDWMILMKYLLGLVEILSTSVSVIHIIAFIPAITLFRLISNIFTAELSWASCRTWQFCFGLKL